MKVRQAIVMVGGKGTRLLPLTENKPKPMLSVADRPCIWYLLKSLASAGIEEVILACGYKPGMMEPIGNGSDLGIRIIYSYEDEPLGTAGAMKNAESKLDDVFIAANGDVFADIDVVAEVDEHLRSNATVTIALSSVDNPTEFGIARVGEDGQILEFKEKPRPEEVFSNLINAGVYVVNKEVLSRVPTSSFYDFSKDLVKDLIAEGMRVQSFMLKGGWRDVGRPYDLLEANLSVASKMSRPVVPGCEISGISYIGPGASVTGSVINDTVISKGSTIKDSYMNRTLIMSGCCVDGAEIIDSILGEGCKVGKGAKISKVILADNTLVSDGEIVEGDYEL